MIHADLTRYVMRQQLVEPSSRRLKYLLGSLEEELTYQDTRKLLQDYVRALRVEQCNPEGESYWTLMDTHETPFVLKRGTKWTVYVEAGTPEKDQEHVLEDLVKLAADLNHRCAQMSA